MTSENNIKVELVYNTPKDTWKEIVQNAKFTEIEQILRTKVGINNFMHISLNVQSSLLLRDIILNSPYVSGWGRSTQVLNDTDSKFSVYQSAIDKYKNYNDELIKVMEELSASGHLQDNMRMLVPLGSITNYAFNVDIMTFVKIIMTLDEVQGELSYEAQLINDKFKAIALDIYDITPDIIESLKNSYKPDIKRDMSYLTKDLSVITGNKVHSSGVTYSVVGQMLRHRTILKNVNFNLDEVKDLTRNFNYNEIETPTEIAALVKSYNEKATSLYETLQGSIFMLNFSGFEPNIQKVFNQRSCCINDTKQFKDIMPSSAIPPCNCNVEKFGCYVGYVNESRLKGEEKTQVPCPIWSEANGMSQFTNDAKYDFFYNNLKSWATWKKRIDKKKGK